MSDTKDTFEKPYVLELGDRKKPLSEIVVEAIEDCESIIEDMDNNDEEGSDREYDLDSQHWHSGEMRSGRCVVCLAGAFMARSTLNLHSSENATPYDYKKMSDQNILHAIDLVRMGNPEYALQRFGYDLDDPEVAKRAESLTDDHRVNTEISWNSEDEWYSKRAVYDLRERADIYLKHGF